VLVSCEMHVHDVAALETRPPRQTSRVSGLCTPPTGHCTLLCCVLAGGTTTSTGRGGGGTGGGMVVPGNDTPPPGADIPPPAAADGGKACDCSGARPPLDFDEAQLLRKPDVFGDDPGAVLHGPVSTGDIGQGSNAITQAFCRRLVLPCGPGALTQHAHPGLQCHNCSARSRVQ